MTESAESVASAGLTRAGYVALVGRPNVGKSALLNALTGERLSIVTPRAQTTREQVLGIHTSARAQIVFVDTPGLLEPKYLLQRSMQATALTALREADVVLLLLDAARPLEETLPPEEALELLRAREADLVVAVNKIDAAAPTRVAAAAAWVREHLDRDAIELSATRGDGVAELRDALVDLLPESPFLYPPDEIAVQPVRFFVAEFVRETIFEEFEQEVPYSTVVRVEEFREADEPVYIRATIYVERETQKAIIIGRQGAGIRRIGERARAKVEAFLGARVYLDLWVKAMPGWRRKVGALRQLGYAVPEAEPPGRGRRRAKERNARRRRR